MKKLVYVVVFAFVAGIGLTTYATAFANDNSENGTIITQSDDEKPCPADCTCAKCEKAKADAKAAGTETKADCNKEAKCANKDEKKACCGSKSATKTDVKEDGKTEKAPEKK